MKIKIFLVLSIFFCLNLILQANNKPGDNQFQKAVEYADRAFEALDFPGAIKYYSEALEIKSSKDVHMRLADCYQKIHKPEKAIAEIENAKNLSALNKEETMMYGETLIDAGSYDEAREVLKDYVNDSYWVEKKVKGISDLDAFFQYEEGYRVSPVSFNTQEAEFSPAFYEDGLVIVGSGSDKNFLSPKYNWDNSVYLDLFQVKEGKAEKMHKKLNTQYHEGPAVFFDGGQKIIFTRNQFEGHNSRIPEKQVNLLKLFYSEKKSNGKWKSPEILPFNISGYSFGHPAINEDGTELFFASNVEGGMGGTDLYKVTFDGEEWSEPVSLGKGINTEKNEQFPFYYEGDLYFASDGLEGLGGLDIFKVDLTGNREPRNVGSPINTKYDDFGLIWSETGKKGYFSSNREGGAGKDDIYEFSVVEHEIAIRLLDEETEKPVSGSIRVVESTKQDAINTVENVNNHKVTAIRGAKLNVTAAADGYETSEATFDTKSVRIEDSDVELELKLKPIKTNNKLYVVVKKGDDIHQRLSINEDGTSPELLTEGSRVDAKYMINQIYYEFDDFEPMKASIHNLDQLAEVLQMNEGLSVTLTGYADPRGNEQYNLKLSEMRARAAGDYLLQKGISTDRLTIEGRGEIEVSGDCGEACLQSYRRTEIEIALE